MHEVLRVIEERVRTGSRPGQRTDGLRVALSIEGGGMRGTVSAGMALALHERGLMSAFDAVYGSSAGAITGAWLLSSEPARLHGWAHTDYARTMIRWSALLHRRPVADVRTLVEVLYQTEFPMDFHSILASAIEFHPLATDAATGKSTDLRPMISNPAELRLAMRASAALPFLAGPPVRLRGRRYYDAGVAESIPFRTPVAQGATHILVLRSRRPPDVTDASAATDGETGIDALAGIDGQTLIDGMAAVDGHAGIDGAGGADGQTGTDGEVRIGARAAARGRAARTAGMVRIGRRRRTGSEAAIGGRARTGGDADIGPEAGADDEAGSAEWAGIDGGSRSSDWAGIDGKAGIGGEVATSGQVGVGELAGVAGQVETDGRLGTESPAVASGRARTGRARSAAASAALRAIKRARQRRRLGQAGQTGQAGQPRPPRSVLLLTRTTLRNESPEFRTALLTRSTRTAADVKAIADAEAEGTALAVFPPASTPPVSRLTTDAVLLAAALESGREAVNDLFSG